jgi:hypothetical protein
MLEGAVGRSDQRVKGELYVRGLLTDGARKSIQPMASRLGVDHQRLQQFVTSSTWDYQVVRANVTRWAVKAVNPAAYVIDDSGFPKDGLASPCVARQYSGTLGKTGNCQVGVSVQLATDTASLAAHRRLFCPKSWDDTTISDPQRAAAVRDRRDRAGIPGEVRHREKWRLALDMLGEMIDRGAAEAAERSDGYRRATVLPGATWMGGEHTRRPSRASVVTRRRLPGRRRRDSCNRNQTPDGRPALRICMGPAVSTILTGGCRPVENHRSRAVAAASRLHPGEGGVTGWSGG